MWCKATITEQKQPRTQPQRTPKPTTRQQPSRPEAFIPLKWGHSFAKEVEDNVKEAIKRGQETIRLKKKIEEWDTLFVRDKMVKDIDRGGWGDITFINGGGTLDVKEPLCPNDTSGGFLLPSLTGKLATLHYYGLPEEITWDPIDWKNVVWYWGYK
jgi:hypothetical protein